MVSTEYGNMKVFSVDRLFDGIFYHAILRVISVFCGRLKRRLNASAKQTKTV